ncbi:hypothetical protein AB4Y30_12590 [Ornithinibacillus sp. 4-3]|uniref:Uncharacterized protein n=1 Tax=Ornithinibacillus sp. 4-3 TaxID=3231488 RepID=A0AB39HHZ5_9BACI
MAKTIVKYILYIIFTLIYLWLIQTFIWNHLPIHSSAGVTIGSIIVFIISAVLAILTSDKIIKMLKG